MRLLKLYFLFAVAVFFFACSDDDEGPEYMFDREISEYSVLYECGSGGTDSNSCFKIRYRYPYRLDDYAGLCLWLDDIIDDTSKAVSDKQIRLAHDTTNKETYFHEYKKTSRYYDTIDVSKMVAPFLKDGYDSLQVALFSEYTDGGDPGAVQHLVLHFKDSFEPSIVVPDDSVWSNGVLLSWDRPTDQTSFHTLGTGTGKIYGYNLVIYAIDRPDEDIRDLKVTVESPAGTDYTGNKIFKRDARISMNDSLYVKEIERSDKDKNYLRLVIFDGEGYNLQNPKKNHFRVRIEGLRTRSYLENYEYKIGFSSWDAVGNFSGSEGDTRVNHKNWKGILTTDSIAPLMPNKIFVEEDSLFPGYAKLDSNNRVRIYWNRSVDPITFKHGITIDSELVIPKACNVHECYENVPNYIVEYYNKLDGSWKRYSYSDESNRYATRYGRNKNGKFELDVLDTGSFVGDTIRRVAPGDTVILRILAVDSSGYKSRTLWDSIFVSPGKLGAELKCPKGFVAVSTSDTTSFCMERLEHQDASGKFVTNVLHSEAVAACEAISASGFEVSLCRERDWELACLSGGSLSYGVIEEDDSQASDYLFRMCNVSTNDSAIAADVAKRDAGCMNPMGVRDLPGQYQEWVMGRSKDSVAVLKGSSYKIFEGLDRESIAYCTNRAFPFYTRPAYTQDTVYLYREGTHVDTAYALDTLRTLYKILTKSDFKDTLQFYDVVDFNGKIIGTDYSLYIEYKRGGKAWLDSLANGLTYKPSRKEAVFLTGEKRYYREAASFYKSSTIGFRCCAYKK